MKNIPFHKAYIDKEEIRNVVDVIKSGWHTMGPKTAEFEERFRSYSGAKFAVSMNSCTAALHLALEAIGIKQGDEVLVPAITFTASAEVVCYFKATPVFVDIEPGTMNISHTKIEAKITPKTRAIVVVDFAGQPADYDEIKKLARKYRLFVIEDAAHTLPSMYKGKMVGTLADITCFSFYATKTLNTGEGGMITTENKKWADRIRSMRLHGMSRDAWKRYTKRGRWHYDVVGAGYKYNTTDINAAMGLAQLDRLEWMWKKRLSVAAAYNAAFGAIPELIVPTEKPDRQSSWHLYVLKLNLEKLKIDRNAFIEKLSGRGIGTSVHFIPVYRHRFYRETFKLSAKDWPDSEWVFKRILSLPIYPGLKKSDIQHIIASVKNIVEQFRK
jgi:dTDP-4-amino-4,6-dideoxygalactose transaminase